MSGFLQTNTAGCWMMFVFVHSDKTECRRPLAIRLKHTHPLTEMVWLTLKRLVFLKKKRTDACFLTSSQFKIPWKQIQNQYWHLTPIWQISGRERTGTIFWVLLPLALWTKKKVVFYLYFCIFGDVSFLILLGRKLSCLFKGPVCKT